MNSIEEDIKIALDKFSDNKDIDSAILIVEKFILGNYILRGGRKNIVKDSLRYILSDYKKLQEEFKQIDHECDRLEKIDFEKDMRIKELQKENEELKEKQIIKSEKIRNGQPVIINTRLTILDVLYFMTDFIKKHDEEFRKDYANISINQIISAIDYFIDNSIPVKKIQNKIEELEKMKSKMFGINNTIVKSQIETLQELLESEE